jgi:hypothetical protein
LFYGALASMLTLMGLYLGIPIIKEYIDFGLVPRLPTAVLAASVMILAALALTCGLILQTVTRGRQETKRLSYLSYPGVASKAQGTAPSLR